MSTIGGFGPSIGNTGTLFISLKDWGSRAKNANGMTTLAALFGALPLALGTGIGSEMRRPLGITIVGGLLVSQLLTLFTTPVTYLWLHRLTRKRRRATATVAVNPPG